jgi:hypothetical protein
LRELWISSCITGNFPEKSWKLLPLIWAIPVEFAARGANSLASVAVPLDFPRVPEAAAK